MDRKKLAALLMGLVVTTAAMAQDDMNEWWQNGRPECIHGTSATAGAVPHGHHKIGSQATAALKAKGVQKIPVVLVAFNDLAFSVADVVEKDELGNIVSRVKGTNEQVNAFYQKFCNGTMDGQLYTGHGSHGSIRDYFVEQSDSIFLPEFVVIGPVTLDNGHAYYGKNSGGTKDVNFSLFRNEAIAKAMATYSDWGQFDNDNNSTIDMVFFVYAGMGESNTNGKYPNLIWPKEFQNATTINDREFSVSAATCECRPLKWNQERTEVVETRTDGVGVFCHELSHAIGLPDFYDTNSVAFGMDLWSVMDYGEYGNNGFNPGNYTAYERDFMGWRPLVELKDPAVLTIPCFADGGYGYKIVNDQNPDEYYIIENRQMKGWDDYVCRMGRGLQVTHVDYQFNRWKSNYVNTDPNHQCMTIIAANNRYIGTNSAEAEAKKNGTKASEEWIITLNGNLYPGSADNHALTDQTTPASTVFTGAFMGKPLCQITQNADGTVTVFFRTLAAPTMEASNVEMETLDLQWPAMACADRYLLECYEGETLVKSEELTATQKHLSGLQPGTTYSFRIKSLTANAAKCVDSDWSPMLTVKTLSPVTLKANDVTVTYGDEIPALTFTAEGGDLTGVPEVLCEVPERPSVGTYEIQMLPGTIASHNVTYVNGLLTIEEAPLTVTALDASRELGQGNPDFTASYDGFKYDDNESVLLTAPSFTCLATPESPVGTYEIEVFGAEAENYDISFVNGVLTVVPPSAVTAVEPESERVVEIYTMSGVRVSRCFGDEIGRLSLRRGVYVIRYSDGTARQVLIK